MCFKLEDRQAFRNLELASTGLPERIPFPFVWYGKEDQTESNMIRVVIAGVAAALTVSGADAFMPEGYLEGFKEVDSRSLGDDLIVKFYERG